MKSFIAITAGVIVYIFFELTISLTLQPLLSNDSFRGFVAFIIIASAGGIARLY